MTWELFVRRPRVLERVAAAQPVSRKYKVNKVDTSVITADGRKVAAKYGFGITTKSITRHVYTVMAGVRVVGVVSQVPTWATLSKAAQLKIISALKKGCAKACANGAIISQYVVGPVTTNGKLMLSVVGRPIASATV
jgi:hypothetical protein